jgi:hypothetical protein
MMQKTRRMLEIEEEFSDDIQQIIQDFREMDGGNSWRTVAGILEVGERTLYRWRDQLGMAKDQQDHIKDPSSLLPGGWSHNSFERRARRMGFESAADAILHCRITLGMTKVETQHALGIGYDTVRAHTPPEMRYPGGWLIRRMQPQQ